jgi:hypothetical protein
VWVLDHDDDPADAARFRRLAELPALLPLIAEIG